MKNLNFLLILLCSFITYQVNAQISIGVKSGYTNAWERYGGVYLPEYAEIHVNGFNVSLIGECQLGERLSIGLEPGFTRRGTADIPIWDMLTPSPIFLGYKMKLDYIELPIIVSYAQPIIPNSLDIVGKLGGGVAYLLKGVAVKERYVPEPVSTTITDQLNRWDYGTHAGLDIRKHLGKHQIVLGTDVYVAFKDVDQFITSKNRSIDINLGYLYTL